MRLVLLDSARANLVEILEYTAKQSGNRTTGRRFADMILRQCERLAGLPGTLGRPRPELQPELRSFAFKGYVIFFRYQDDTFEVVNVLQGHRDIVSYFKDDDA